MGESFVELHVPFFRLRFEVERQDDMAVAFVDSSRNDAGSNKAKEKHAQYAQGESRVLRKSRLGQPYDGGSSYNEKAQSNSEVQP